MSYVVITQTVTARETSGKRLDYVDASEIAWEIGYESIGDPEFVSVNVQCTICDQFNHHCRCLIPGCDPERASVMSFGAFFRDPSAHQELQNLDSLLAPGALARFADSFPQ